MSEGMREKGALAAAHDGGTWTEKILSDANRGKMKQARKGKWAVLANVRRIPQLAKNN